MAPTDDSVKGIIKHFAADIDGEIQTRKALQRQCDGLKIELAHRIRQMQAMKSGGGRSDVKSIAHIVEAFARIFWDITRLCMFVAYNSKPLLLALMKLWFTICLLLLVIPPFVTFCICRQLYHTLKTPNGKTSPFGDETVDHNSATVKTDSTRHQKRDSKMWQQEKANETPGFGVEGATEVLRRLSIIESRLAMAILPREAAFPLGEIS